MRMHVRTSRNTAISAGPITWIILILLMVALPIYAVEMLFSTWWSAAITIIVLVLLIVLRVATKRTASEQDAQR